jgi:hypothetical protein
MSAKDMAIGIIDLFSPDRVRNLIGWQWETVGVHAKRESPHHPHLARRPEQTIGVRPSRSICSMYIDWRGINQHA